MNPPRQPRSKTMTDLDLPGDVLQKKLEQTASGSLEQLRAERDRVEQYTKDQFARLGKLRDILREEKAAAEREIEQKRLQLAQQPEHQVLTERIRELEQQLQTLTNERTTALSPDVRQPEQPEQQPLQPAEQSQSEVLAQRIHELEQQLQNITNERAADLRGLEQPELEVLRQRNQELEQRLQSLSNERAVGPLPPAVLAQLERLQLSLKKVEAERNAAREQLRLLVQQGDHEILRRQIRDLQRERDRLQAERDKFASQLKQAPTPPGETDLLRTRLADLEQQLAQTQAQKAEADLQRAKLTELEQQLQHAQAEQGQALDLRAKLASFEQQHEQSQRSLAEAHQQRDAVRQELAQAAQELAQSRQELARARIAAVTVPPATPADAGTGPDTNRTQYGLAEWLDPDTQKGEEGLLRKQVEELQKKLEVAQGQLQRLRDQRQEILDLKGVRDAALLQVQQLIRELETQDLQDTDRQRVDQQVQALQVQLDGMRHEHEEAIRKLGIEQDQWARQEEELIAQRRRLKTEERRLADLEKALVDREHALRERES